MFRAERQRSSWGGVAMAGALLMAMIGITASHHAQAGIANTKHNLGTAGTGPNKVTTGTGEICVFCHTPHAADTTAPAPLWNKNLGSLGGYQTYATLNSSTIDGQILSVGSVSLACLSCHDGTQAMDNIINAPGSGGLDVTGGGPNGLGYTWATGANVTVDANGKLTSGTVAMLGQDLSNDHPIGIEYCGGGISGTTGVTGCKDNDFKGGAGNPGLQTAVINSRRVWWVDTSVGTAGVRDKTDMVLYTRNFAAGDGPSVECATCHDPHTDANPTFLRVSQTTPASGVCLACHVK